MSSIQGAETLLEQNGFLPSAHLQADFYAKLSRLENEVLTGRHPLFKLPQAAIERLTAVINHNSTSRASPTARADGQHETKLQSTFIESIPAPVRPETVAKPPFQQPPRAPDPLTVKPIPSAFDPVLLSKSDHLLSAELVLKRQRIERTLRQAVERKKLAPRDKDWALLEGPNTFDLSQVHEAAVALVKPVSGLQPVVQPVVLPAASNGASSSSSPFDNGYYSSQVNSWSPEERECLPHASTTKSNARFGGSKLDIPGHGPGDKPVALVHDIPNSGLERDDFGRDITRRADCINKLPLENLKHADARDLPGNGIPLPSDTDGFRENSYSPPAATARSELPSDDPSIRAGAWIVPPRHAVGPRFVGPKPKPHSRTTRVRESESYSPPPPEVRVVKDHISIPLGPQPVRVSPLTVNHVPEFFENEQRPEVRRPQDGRGTTQIGKRREKRKRNPSKLSAILGRGAQDNLIRPGIPQQNQLKRKRGPELGERSLRSSGNHIVQPAQSPLPHIKAEPISPPPFSGGLRTEPPRRLVLRDDGRADIEILSPRNAGNTTTNMAHEPSTGGSRYYDPSNPSHGDHDQVLIGSPNRLAPLIRRRIGRDGTDLRRIASVQYATRPLSPTEQHAPYFNDEVHYVQGPSRLVERPVFRQPQYIDEPMTQPRIRYVPPDGRSSPFYHQGEIMPIEAPTRRTMPPPAKKRIIIDEHGHEYVAVPAATYARQSMIREVPYAEPSVSYDRNPYRAQSIIIEQPQPVYRWPQVIEIDDDDDEPLLRIAPQTVQQRRSVVRQRAVEAPDHQMRPGAIYQDRLEARAGSLQPVPLRTMANYRQGPASATFAADQGPYRAGERMHSARPTSLEHLSVMPRREEYSAGENEYDEW